MIEKKGCRKVMYLKDGDVKSIEKRKKKWYIMSHTDCKIRHDVHKLIIKTCKKLIYEFTVYTVNTHR